jgi:hypothetical protein
MVKPGRPNQFDKIHPIGAARRSRLTPLAPLPTEAQPVFDLIIRENPHLTATDVPLVMGYALASMRVFKAAKRSNAAEWERASRIQTMYATKLRLTPQSTQDPQALGRRKKDMGGFGVTWEQLGLDNDDDDDDGGRLEDGEADDGGDDA